MVPGRGVSRLGVEKNSRRKRRKHQRQISESLPSFLIETSSVTKSTGQVSLMVCPSPDHYMRSSAVRGAIVGEGTKDCRRAQ